MNLRKKIRVLVVDDSLFVREALSRGLEQDPSIEVVSTACDAYDARDKIIEYEPDVMTLDVNLPKMNGIDFLRKLMPQYPLPVVVVSSVSESIFDALSAGAVDFVTKTNLDKGVDSLISELMVKIKIASTAKLGQWKNNSSQNTAITHTGTRNNTNTLIAIGASTGGTEAVAHILKALPREMPGIVIVQHMPPVFTKMYAERLNNICLLEVKEAQDRDKIYPGRVLIAPGDYHMRVRKEGSEYIVECFKGEKVNGHCPSVEVLFDSVAEKVGKDAVGIILTGMGADGAKGLLNMKKKGARTVGQNEASCVVYGMPKVAYEIGAVEEQISLENIANTIYSMVNGGEK